jgi:hypothetical protein
MSQSSQYTPPMPSSRGLVSKASRRIRRLSARDLDDYKATSDLDGALAAACPEGIDAFFDNTSGAIQDACFGQINLHGRIAICGTASYASWDPFCFGEERSAFLEVTLRRSGSGRPRAVINRLAIS